MEGSTSDATLRFPMSSTWRLCFVLLGALGLVGIVYGGLSLAGVLREEASTAELIVAILFGVAIQPFAWSGLKHSRIEIDRERMTYLAFGFLCRTAELRFNRVRRFGVGEERGSGGGTEKILLIDLSDGTEVRIKLAMYDRSMEIVAAIAERTDLPEEPTERGFFGARFDEDA